MDRMKRMLDLYNKEHNTKYSIENTHKVVSKIVNGPVDNQVKRDNSNVATSKCAEQKK